MRLRNLHGVSALIVAMFASVHVANHLVAVGSIESHMTFMHAARLLYRSPAVEALVLLSVAFQVCSGLALVVRGWKQRQGFVAWLQAGAGAYLAFFLLVHGGAVLFGRASLRLDTNFYFAAAGFHVPPFPMFFAPYYFLAVLSLFVHLGCALYWQLQTQSRLARGLAVLVPSLIGFFASLLIVLSLAGVFYPVDVPAEYKSSFRRHQ